MCKRICQCFDPSSLAPRLQMPGAGLAEVSLGGVVVPSGGKRLFLFGFFSFGLRPLCAYAAQAESAVLNRRADPAPLGWHSAIDAMLAPTITVSPGSRLASRAPRSDRTHIRHRNLAPPTIALPQWDAPPRRARGRAGAVLSCILPDCTPAESPKAAGAHSWNTFHSSGIVPTKVRGIVPAKVFNVRNECQHLRHRLTTFVNCLAFLMLTSGGLTCSIVLGLVCQFRAFGVHLSLVGSIGGGARSTVAPLLPRRPISGTLQEPSTRSVV